jgi:hypothetical protein
MAMVSGVLLPGAAPAQGWWGRGDGRAEPSRFGALACYELAEAQVSLGSREALQLCRGATSAAPAECYIAATPPRGLLSERDAIALCRCATSLEPVECYERADAETFLYTWEILQLCAPSQAYRLGLDCLPIESPLYPLFPPYR